MCVAAHAIVAPPFPNASARSVDGIAFPGRNCWRVEASDRAAVLMDADAYFRAVSEAIGRARHSVLILSWDIDSRTGLAGGRSDGTHRLADVLHDALDRHPHLTVRVLNWDFALIYAFEREMLARLRPEWSTHPRLHLRFDGTHPVGACHHQRREARARLEPGDRLSRPAGRGLVERDDEQVRGAAEPAVEHRGVDRPGAPLALVATALHLDDDGQHGPLPAQREKVPP